MRAIYGVFTLVFVHLAARIADGLGLESGRQLGDGEPGESALQCLFQRVVNEFVLFLRRNSRDCVTVWNI